MSKYAEPPSAKDNKSRDAFADLVRAREESRRLGYADALAWCLATDRRVDVGALQDEIRGHARHLGADTFAEFERQCRMRKVDP